MRNTSSAYKKQIKGIREFCTKIIINYADGSTQTLTDLQDFKQLKFVDECSGSSEFELGAAVIGEALITLNNRTGKFDGKNFYGAHISAYAGILVNRKPELLEMGHYIVDEPVSPGISIALTAYDNMILLEKAYVPGITYPATLGNITKDICAQCGVILESSDFPRNSYVVESAPENATCREVLASAAQLAGCFAKARANGRIAIAWYAAASSLTVDTLRNKSICTDDVTITGITVSKGESTAQAGADGYRLSIIDNILLEEPKIQETANYLASKLVGLSFRPLSVSCQSDPSIEAGDRITIKDGDATYATVVTSTTFAVLEAQKVACNAASPTVNAGKRLSETSKAIIANRKYTDEAMEHERTERETALDDLNKQLAEASGMYTTAQKQADGSTIYYTHDKPELKDSKIVWKLTATALGISTDGGKTYPIGLDVSGTAILNRIYVTGIDGKYVKIENEKLSEYVEKINQTATDAKKKAESATNTANKTVAAMSVEYYKSTSATELKGGTWQSGAVTATQGYYIWSRTKTTAQDGTVTYSQAACITGSTGEDGVSPTATVSKANGVTTITITDKNGTHTQKVTDGIDGTPGTSGVDGKTSYFHVKYSNDGGKTFTGNSGETVGDWLGTYTDFTKADSTDVSAYTWSKIKGDTGAAGKGVKSIVPQYYLSTSKTAQTGGTWATTQPAWQPNHYIWTRSYITWSDSTTSATTPILAQALNDANQKGYDNAQSLETIKKTVTKQGSSLETMETQIKEKVWKEDITTEVKKISVGGRNLAESTNQGVTGWFWVMQTGGYTRSEVVENNVKTCKLLRDSVAQTGWSVICYDRIGRYKWEPDTVYTVSVDVKPSVSTNFNIAFREANGTNNLIISGEKSIQVQANKWNKMIWNVKTASTLPTSTSQVFYATEMNSGTGVWYQFKNLKIEKGNQATDWTPAPEDVQSSIDTAQSTADNVQTTVTQTRTEVESLKTSTEALTTAMKEYTKSTDFEEYKKQVSSQLSQTPDAIEARFATIEQNVSKVGNASDNKWAQLETYIRLTQNGIALGKSDSPITLEIRNDRICFVQSGQVVAYYTNNQLHNSNLIVTTTANILGLIFTKSGRHLQIS